MTTATVISLSEDWEDFEVPNIVIPIEPEYVHNVKSINTNIKEKSMPKILTEDELREKNIHQKELKIAFEKAKQKYIDYQIKTVYKSYKHMNTYGKKITIEKINNEIKKYNNANSILTKLQIQMIVDSGGILGGMEMG
jgi:hypothetical protein